ncbi:ribbon-helix-helix domain-containing protein [uncultured Sphingomonas sp.]|uniref:ribbon-helix-helix domain-containing protein n=1 Tax=uncultured Sphingomonas sp. TaxID=158754 RepID=UPI0025D52737|nr:ribbon-helix-helix domain-containing protein [uncultured Sphingomonas sp.]
MIVAPPGGFVGPVKRSVTIAGHATSVSLEPVFWAAIERAAVAHALPLSALVAQIDALRIAQDDPPNLASALRTWLVTQGYENPSQ